jgi:hypothetical protein
MTIKRREVRIDVVNGSKVWLDFILSNAEAGSVDGIVGACAGLGGGDLNKAPGIIVIILALIKAEAQEIHDKNKGNGVWVTSTTIYPTLRTYSPAHFLPDLPSGHF